MVARSRPFNRNIAELLMTAFDMPSRSRLNKHADTTHNVGGSLLVEHRTQVDPNFIAPEERLELRYYDILTVLAATTAVAVNFLALKVTRIGPLTFGGAVVFF